MSFQPIFCKIQQKVFFLHRHYNTFYTLLKYISDIFATCFFSQSFGCGISEGLYIKNVNLTISKSNLKILLKQIANSFIKLPLVASDTATRTGITAAA